MSCPSPRSRSRSAAIALALTLTLSGCAADAHLDNRHSGTTESTSTPSSSAAPTSPFDPTIRNAPPTNVDYAALLLQASDLSSTDDTFALRTAKQDPSGLPGASALFVNADDTRAISVTVARYPDAAVATATLREAVTTSNTVVSGGDPRPLAVGTGGTVIKGSSPDGQKAVTLVLFTQDNILARLEFNSATGDATTDRFVTDIARMQQIALRVGLPGGAN